MTARKLLYDNLLLGHMIFVNPFFLLLQAMKVGDRSVCDKKAGVKDGLKHVCKEKLGRTSLRSQQKEAVLSLLSGKDVFAILPTGLVKYHFPEKYWMNIHRQKIMVISLQSIIQEQLASNKYNLDTMESSLQDVLKSIKKGDVEVIYMSVENVLSDQF